MARPSQSASRSPATGGNSSDLVVATPPGRQYPVGEGEDDRRGEASEQRNHPWTAGVGSRAGDVPKHEEIDDNCEAVHEPPPLHADPPAGIEAESEDRC